MNWLYKHRISELFLLLWHLEKIKSNLNIKSEVLKYLLNISDHWCIFKHILLISSCWSSNAILRTLTHVWCSFTVMLKYVKMYQTKISCIDFTAIWSLKGRLWEGSRFSTPFLCQYWQWSAVVIVTFQNNYHLI